MTDLLRRPAASPRPTDLSPPRPPVARSTPRSGAVAWTGLIVGMLTIAAMLMPGGGPAVLRVPVALAFACLGPGAALLARRRSSDPVVTWALVILVSLAAFAAGATALVWAQWWRPQQVALAAAAVVAAVCLAALVRAGRSPAAGQTTAGQTTAGQARARQATARQARAWLARTVAWRPERATVGHAIAVTAVVALWLVTLAGTDAARVGEFGLLASVHPAFFAALVLCVAGFVAELRRPGGGRGAVLGGYLVLLIVTLHATVPALLDQAQYAWTYKHVGVVELILDQGGLTDSGDLYQQWPALFAGVAGLAELAGVAPLSLAPWAPVFFNLAGALVLLAIGRTLSADRRLGYLMVFLFLCINWIEEDYLSPQAFAFLLSLGVLLVVLRWLRRDPSRQRQRKRLGWLTAGLPPAPAVSVRQRAAALAVLLLLFAVLTASHQLSPYLLVGQVAVLAVLAVIRPSLTALVLAAVALAYLLPRFGLVSGSFNVFEGFDIFSNASGNADGWGSTGQAFSAIVVRTLAVVVWGLAGLAVWRARRRLGTVLVPALLAVSPFVLLLTQSYGGEAVYRVFLFSAPWCAYLIADLVLRMRGGPGSTRRAVVWAVAILALAGAALGTVQGRHGQLMVDRQTTAEVAAAEHLYAHGTPGATVALATSNFPSRLAGNYGEFNQSLAVGEPELIIGGELRGAWLDETQLPAIEGFLGWFDSTTSYLVVSDGMQRQAEYFGYLPDGSLDALEESLATAPGWSVFYRNDEVVVYEFDG